jgi:glycosyltransferase involved in cell wall biosynthesis
MHARFVWQTFPSFMPGVLTLVAPDCFQRETESTPQDHRKMRLVVASSSRPHPDHTIRAANVVIFELLRALAATPGMTVAFVHVGHEGDSRPTDEEAAGQRAMAEMGITVLDEIFLPVRAASGTRWQRLLGSNPRHYYPDVGESAPIRKTLEAWQADALLVPWAEWLTAACADIPITKFAYYGNPDPKSQRQRATLDRQLGGSFGTYLRTLFFAYRLERVHLRLMRNYAFVGDVAANDAGYYASKGHPNAFYIRNIWIDRLGEQWRGLRAVLELKSPNAIIANVGKLGGTANRSGLRYLGQNVLPELLKLLPDRSFDLQILGAGSLDAETRALLDDPAVSFPGFVPDIDTAILSAPIFLCVNNATQYKVGHTRYLHAWSLGACVIAHQDAALSMPELVHGHNALLGGSAREIAELIVQARTDAALRRRIGDAGYRTYRDHFKAENVAQDVVQRLLAGPHGLVTSH